MTRSKVNRVKADLRTLATALESYFVDQNTYPPPNSLQILPSVLLTTPVSYIPSEIVDPHKTDAGFYANSFVSYLYYTNRLAIVLVPAVLAVFIFVWRIWKYERIGGIWLTALFVLAVLPIIILFIAAGPELYVHVENPLWNGKDKGYNYYSDVQTGWVLQAVGPNGLRDLEDLSNFPLHRPSTPAELEQIIPCTYDPTNGAESAGDIFRFQE